MKKFFGYTLICIAYILSLYPVWSLILDQPVNELYASLNIFICFILAFIGSHIKSDKSFSIFFKIIPIIEILWGIGLFTYFIYLKGFVKVILYTILTIICWYTVKWVIKEIFDTLIYWIQTTIKHEVNIAVENKLNQLKIKR